MLFTMALVLLVVWCIGVIGLYEIGDFVHGFLLVGMMLLLLGLLRLRDAAAVARRAGDRSVKA